ncbi:MAG TPA: hypothetical protein PLW71_01915, partial [Candidatus Syntrophosphaera thermopropionivorans]|nr:hypothetical protein [Candidatus Syntrophosphaera thermopropionivorans]
CFPSAPINLTLLAVICSLILSLGTTSFVRAFPRLIRIIRTSFYRKRKKAEEIRLLSGIIYILFY